MLFCIKSELLCLIPELLCLIPELLCLIPELLCLIPELLYSPQNDPYVSKRPAKAESPGVTEPL